MNKEELREKFERNVEYLRKNIPPDDIYLFAEQTFMAAMYFLHKWGEHVDIVQEIKTDVVADKWVHNIVGLYLMKESNEDIELDLNLNSVEDE